MADEEPEVMPPEENRAAQAILEIRDGIFTLTQILQRVEAMQETIIHQTAPIAEIERSNDIEEEPDGEEVVTLETPATGTPDPDLEPKPDGGRKSRRGIRFRRKSKRA